MKKIIVFGSKHCPDCQPMQDYLKENNIDFIYLDITENMIYLKTFLKLRDTREEFAEIKAKGLVGIPCVNVNDGEALYFEKPSIDSLI